MSIFIICVSVGGSGLKLETQIPLSRSELILFLEIKTRSVCADGGEQLGGLFGGDGRLDTVGLNCVIVVLRTSLVEKAEY